MCSNVMLWPEQDTQLCFSLLRHRDSVYQSLSLSLMTAAKYDVASADALMPRSETSDILQLQATVVGSLAVHNTKLDANLGVQCQRQEWVQT